MWSLRLWSGQENAEVGDLALLEVRLTTPQTVRPGSVIGSRWLLVCRARILSRQPPQLTVAAWGFLIWCVLLAGAASASAAARL